MEGPPRTREIGPQGEAVGGWRERLEKEVEEIAAPNLLVSEQEREANNELRTERFVVHNCEILFYGAQHTPETLAAHIGELRGGIKEADLVILEASPEIQRGEQSVEGHEQRTKELSGPGEPFFQGLTNLAALEGKRVALVDPLNLSGASRAEAVEYRRQWSHDLPDTIIRGSGALLAAGLATEGAAALMKKNPAMSRRGFLRGAGRTAIAAGAIGVMSQAAAADLDDPSGKIREMSGVRRGAEETMAYSLNDLRNIIIAEKLELLSEILPKGTKIFIGYGDGHREPIKDYLSHADWREAKKRVYQATGNYVDSRAALGVWRFDSENGSWANDTAQTKLLTKLIKQSD